MGVPEAGMTVAPSDITTVGIRAVRSCAPVVSLRIDTETVRLSWSMDALCTAALAGTDVSKVNDEIRASLLSSPVSLLPENVTSTGVPLKSMVMLMKIDPSLPNVPLTVAGSSPMVRDRVCSPEKT